MYERIQRLTSIATDSLFLWGARQTGKSTLLKALFPQARFYDLLKSDTYARLSVSPATLRQEVQLMPSGSVVVIDEVQKVPSLLDEVHWLMTNCDIRFVLCGSSARKLRRQGVNLLGGRALREVLYPLVSAEIPDFDLDRAVNNGMLPRHYAVENPKRRMQAYIGDYLQQEIVAESIVRRLDSFTRFLSVAAMSDADVVNYTNIAQDCGISAKSVKEYFSILEETLLGYMIPAFSRGGKRRVVMAPKFYYFDVGIPNYLLGRLRLQRGTAAYGHAFEHLMVQETIAYLGYYFHGAKSLAYWRTADHKEVDMVIGDAEVAIEIKTTTNARSRDTAGLKDFGEDFPHARLILVTHDPYPKLLNGVEVLPAEDFLRQLWAHDIVKRRE